MKRIDILIVAYEKEDRQLSLLLKSIKRYFESTSLGSVIIVTQEEGCVYKEFLMNKYSDFSLDIKYHSQFELIDQPDYKIGWHLQQILKLLSYKFVSSDFYLILDTKNFFVNPVSFNDFVLNERALYKLCSERNQMSTAMGSYFINSYSAFDLNVDDYWDISMGPVTPFVFNKDVTNEMVHHLFSKYGRDNFVDIFIKDINGCEFYLYSAFCYKFGYFDKFHSARSNGQFAITLFKKQVEDIDLFNFTINSIRDMRIKVFGIHKTAFPLLDDEKKQILSDMLSRLLSPTEIEDYFKF